MASFTDKAPTFNPYVQQQPVEAMVKVGMHKQQQYEQNLQGIQSTMNKIGSLNILRDADKKYVNDKMNKLTSKLQTFAAGDFSNSNLTRSVTGMISEVGGDETVQTAVLSTQKYQNQQRRIQQAQEDGTLTPDNLHHFQKRASPWLSSDKAGESFNAQYIDHFDILEYTKEVFDEIKPDSMEYDDMFNGVDKDGNPVLTPAMKRMKKEGIMPEKAAQVINQIFSDPRVTQQLGISGEYALRGLDTEKLQDKLFQQQTSSLEFIEAQRAQLEVQKALGKDVQKGIDSLDSATQSVNDNFDKYMQLAKDNPDVLKAQLYTDDQRMRYTKMFSNVKESATFHEDPNWKGNFAIQKEANTQARHRDDQILKWANHNMTKEKYANDYKVAMAEATAEVDGGFTSGTPFQAQEDALFDIETYANADLNKKAGEFGRASNDVIWQGNFIDDHWEELQAMTRDGIDQSQAINTIIEKQAAKDKKYISVDENGNNTVNVDAFKTDYIARIQSEYNKNTTGLVDKNNPLQNKLATYNNAKEDYLGAKEVKDSIEDMFIDEINRIDTSQVFKTLEPVTLDEDYGKLLNGKTLTPQDLLDLRIILEYGQNQINISDEAKNKGKYADIAKKRLVAKHGDKATSSLMFLTQGQSAAALRPAMRALDDTVQDIDFTEPMMKKAAILRNTYSKKPNMVLPVGTGDLEKDRTLLSNIRALAASGEGIYDNPQNASANFKTFLSNVNEEDATMMKLGMKANIVNDEKGETYVVLKQGTASENSDMTISLAQARKLKLNVGALYEPDEITTLRMRLKRNNSTSNSNPALKATYRAGESKFKNDWFPQMKGSKKYNVQANIELVHGKYVPYVYYKKYDESGAFVADKVLNMGGDPSLGVVVEKLRQYISPYFLSINE